MAGRLHRVHPKTGPVSQRGPCFAPSPSAAHPWEWTLGVSQEGQDRREPLSWVFRTQTAGHLGLSVWAGPGQEPASCLCQSGWPLPGVCSYRQVWKHLPLHLIPLQSGTAVFSRLGVLECPSRPCPLQVPGVLKDLSFPEGARKLWPREFFLVPAGTQRMAHHSSFSFCLPPPPQKEFAGSRG